MDRSAFRPLGRTSLPITSWSLRPLLLYKMGPLNLEIPFTLVASVLAFSWITIHDSAGIIVFSPVYGFFAGAITTITLATDASPSPSLDVLGERMGMLLVPWALGLLVGIPISGAIFCH